MERVGRMGDGGKWVCGMSRYEQLAPKKCIVYSFGVQTESSFGMISLLSYCLVSIALHHEPAYSQHCQTNRE